MQRVKGGVGYHYAIFSANVFKYDVGCDVMFPRSDLKGHGNLIIGITSKGVDMMKFTHQYKLIQVEFRVMIFK